MRSLRVAAEMLSALSFGKLLGENLRVWFRIRVGLEKLRHQSEFTAQLLAEEVENSAQRGTPTPRTDRPEPGRRRSLGLRCARLP